MKMFLVENLTIETKLVDREKQYLNCRKESKTKTIFGKMGLSRMLIEEKIKFCINEQMTSRRSVPFQFFMGMSQAFF